MIKHRFSRERMSRAGGGEEASCPAASSHTITAVGANPEVCPAPVKLGHPGAGIPGEFIFVGQLKKKSTSLGVFGFASPTPK